MSKIDDEKGLHQIHVNLPIDVYTKLRSILDGASISGLFRVMATRYVEIYDNKEVRGSRIDKLTSELVKDDFEKAIKEGLHDLINKRVGGPDAD